MFNRLKNIIRSLIFRLMCKSTCCNVKEVLEELEEELKEPEEELKEPEEEEEG
jgi:hypothetical protein